MRENSTIKKWHASLMAFVVGCIVLILAGCSPEDIEINVNTSDIVKATEGTYGMAKASVSFDIDDFDLRDKIQRIRAAVLPYLGKDGKCIVRGHKITAEFNVPVVAENYFGEITEKPLAILVLRGSTLKFEPTARIDSLNWDLREIDIGLDVDLKAKHVVFKIAGDGGAICKVKATAVFINGVAKVNYVAEVGDDDFVDIEFRCDNESSIYHQIQPFIEIEK